MTASHPSETAGTAEPSPQTLPEYWPVESPVQPESATWLPWPIAVVLAPLFWLMPKRMGIHFAESRWPGAIVAHIVWMSYGIGCITTAVEGQRYSLPAYLAGQWPGQASVSMFSQPTLSEVLRAPLALLVDLLTHDIKNGSELLAGLGVMLAVELGVLMIAASLMPYAAAGEKTRRLFARCVKLTLWSTTSLVVLGLGLQVIMHAAGRFGSTPAVVAGAISLYVAMFVWMWLRSALRYGGPPEGPGWEPRYPRCEGCEYRLTGLTASHRCPECGLPVSHSLPQIRRPPPFAMAATPLTRLVAYLRTALRSWTDLLFYKRLAVASGHADARHFAVYSCAFSACVFATLVVVCTFLLKAGLVRFFSGDEELVVGFVFWVVSCVALTAVLVLTLGLIAASCSRFGLSPVRHWATIALYQADWILAFILAAAFATLCLYRADDLGYLRGIVRLGPSLKIPWALISVLVCYSIPLLIFVLGGVRLSRALKQTRFANG